MIYFLRQKSDTLEATEKFLADAAPYGKIKRLRSDNGGEFISQGFKTLYVSMQFDTRLVPHILRIKTAQLKEHGGAYSAWLGVCC